MHKTPILVASLLMGASLGCQSTTPPPASPAATGANVTTSPSVVELRHVVASNDTAAPATAGPKVASVGAAAPDFELGAYHQGKFTTVKLSDFRGKWVLLCFYPGDFTFV